MAQIRSKQISDFLSTVNFGTLSTSDKTKIANAADTKLYIDEQIAGLSGGAGASIDSLEIQLSSEIFDARQYTSDEMLRAQTEEGILAASIDSLENMQAMDHTEVIASIDSLEVALSAEISATNSDVTRIDANVATEKGRIDAILLASDADKDSFAEIVSVINAVDLTNDNAVAQVILDLNAEISATNADVTSINTRATELEGALSTEIAATNADVNGINNSIDSLEFALSAEIAATNADFVSVEGKISGETSRALASEGVLTNDLSTEVARAFAAEGVLTNDLSTEVARAFAAEEVLADDLSALSTEVVNEVASIDTRLGAVSGNLVDSVDSLELALTAEISATNADFVEVNSSIDSLELALSAEIAATNGDVTSIEGKFSTEKSRVESVEALLSAEIIAEHNEHVSTELVLDGKISTEKGRIDAILLASDADKDTFAEIVSLINQVDTTNDNAFASYALATDASIDSLEVALTAEISATNADVTSIDTRLGAVGASLVDSVDSLELALSAEISATNADFTSLEAVVSAADSVEKARAIAAEGSLETFFNGEVATLSDNIDALEVAHDARLDALEGYIMEDVQMVEEFKTGNGLSYTLDFNVQDDNKSLVNAFVNGHRVKVSSVEGTAIALVTPGYVIDEDDTVVFVYQK